MGLKRKPITKDLRHEIIARMTNESGLSTLDKFILGPEQIEPNYRTEGEDDYSESSQP